MAITLLVQAIFSVLPYHTDIGMDATMTSLMQSTMIVSVILAGQYLDLWPMFALFGLILAFESVSTIIAIYKFIKSLVPFA